MSNYSNLVKMARIIKKGLVVEAEDCRCSFDHNKIGEIEDCSNDECYVVQEFGDDIYFDGGYGDCNCSDNIAYRDATELCDRLNHRLPRSDDENGSHNEAEFQSIVDWVEENELKIYRIDGGFSNRYSLYVVEEKDIEEFEEEHSEAYEVEAKDLAWVHTWKNHTHDQCFVSVERYS